uniref:RxLR effector protein n=1 Tax=Phytophthora sojae TaxID=67593 RepID=G1FQY1_PHYSO|nr:Avh30 [Phytophthora sojae]AEK80520.1 Avh30 [Phytophthora sojae]
MRFYTLVLVATTGLLACNDAASAASSAKITKVSKVISRDQGVQRQFIGGVADDRQLLRAQPEGNDDDDSKPTDDDQKSKYETSADTKTKSDDPDEYTTAKSGKSSSGKGEERGIIVDGLYEEKYEDWFDEGKTPGDVADDLGLGDFGLFENPIKRRIYRGYKRFYRDACDEPRNQRFCRENEDGVEDY